MSNPYNPSSVTKYDLNPAVVDMIGFCSKNPTPMLKYMDLLKPYGQYWFVTITPYGKEIEPNVPDKDAVMETFSRLSEIVGIDSMGWRYDPILIDQVWTIERHIETFSYMASKLAGYTKTCVISFIDLYEKVKRNYPEARTVSPEDQRSITYAFVEIGKRHCNPARIVPPWPVATAVHPVLFPAAFSGQKTAIIMHINSDIPLSKQ